MSKKRNQKRAKKQKQWEREAQQIKEMRIKAPYIKTVLKGRGCVLPFYDYLDSYADEFQRIADVAKQDHPSLLGIHEVDDRIFDDSKGHWSELGYGALEQVFYRIDESVSDYGAKKLDANLCGSMITFLDAQQNVRSVILIRRSVKASSEHRDLKYALKIASLVHEIGHVHDLEQGINFDVPGRRMNVIEAEVFAHLFALEEMAKRSIVASYTMLLGGLRDAVPKGGYLGEVAQKALEGLPQHRLTEWGPVLDSVPLTNEEAKKIGQQGVKTIQDR